MLEKAEPDLGEESSGECWISAMEFDEHDQTASGDDPTFEIDEVQGGVETVEPKENWFRSPTESDKTAFMSSRQARETK